MFRTSALILAVPAVLAAGKIHAGEPQFQTSDRCIACHNELTTPSGKDVSIGFEWRASMMANSSRDPYWQASVRRETIDHSAVAAEIEDDCSICHMPIVRYEAKLAGRKNQVFAHLPFAHDKKHGGEAADGVDCSVCHQIGPQKLGTRESFNGGFVIDAPAANNRHAEYGPYTIDPGQQLIMRTSTQGFVPTLNNDQIKKSDLCGSCHTLYTTAYDAQGKPIGSLPEQVPFQEWQHSDYAQKNQTCQDCHMPTEPEPVPITRVFGVPRTGMKRHVFVGANFFLERMLNRYRDDLEVAALPAELTAASRDTVEFLERETARVRIENVRFAAGHLEADVVVENLAGHKLPTAYPSRRCWVHFSVHDQHDRVVFESGTLRPNGSIVGNDNDDDPLQFEPHYTEITRGDQVQIYEDIMADSKGQVTTGLESAVRYIKDNRLLPNGFDKRTADPDIAVAGGALEAPAFKAGGDTVRYAVDLAGAQSPLRIDVELWYQPIGFRWAHNLAPYNSAAEPRRFVAYFESMAQNSAQILAHVAATTASAVNSALK